MIHYYKTINGRIRQQEELEGGCWVNVVNPDEREINDLIRIFSLEPDFLRAALDEEESSRIETEDGNTLIIIDAPVAEKSDSGVSYSTIPMGILVTAENVITVCLKESAILSEFAEGVVKGVQTSLKTQFVLHLILRVATRRIRCRTNWVFRLVCTPLTTPSANSERIALSFRHTVMTFSAVTRMPIGIVL